MNTLEVAVGESYPSNGDFTYSESALTAQMKFLLGRILTVVDASISNPEQKKAIKDLISKEIWERRDWIVETGTGNGSVGNSLTTTTE